MNLLIISDLHIDTCDSFGAFQWDEMEFISQVERIRDQYNIDKVVFNGDIFELLKYSYDEISRANPVLIGYFGSKDFIFIKGNHDMVNDFGRDSVQFINSAGQKIYIEHGHNADWFNGSRFGRVIGKMGFSVLKKMSNSKYLMNLYFSIVTKGEQINHIPKRYDTLKYLIYALKLLKEHDTVILGHTHKLESHHTYYLNNKKRYLNCGTCSMGRFQGIVLDTESMKYELIRETTDSIRAGYEYMQVTG
ncbi:MAG: metallophosphoesterase family protein [Bacteroidota bacterium]